MNKDLSSYDYIKKQDYDAVAGPDWPSYDQFRTHQNIQKFVYDEIDAMISEPKPFNNPSFCVLPFYGIEYPQNTPCCLLNKGFDLDQIKTDMLSGHRNSSCQDCWKLEDAGIKSDRQIKNETLDFYFDKSIHTLFNQCLDKKNSIVNYKIDGSNLCNATCVTCYGGNSSAWAKLENKYKLSSARTWKFRLDQPEHPINYATAQHITFRGGESLLIDEHFQILERLLAAGNQNCAISFVTNGSTRLNRRQRGLISQFKNMNFCFSIDGVGPVFEYLRFPLKWSDLLENIKRCRDDNIIASVSYTVSNLNILYHEQTTQWFRENQLIFITNPVVAPEYFRPESLPLAVKQQIMKQYPSTDFLLNRHSANDDALYKEFQQQIALQDQIKSIHIQDYLPDLVRLLG